MIFNINSRQEMKCIVILLILICLNVSCSNQSSKPYPPDSFLKERYEVRSFLNRSFSSIPEEAFLITPWEKINVIDANWPGDEHIKSVAEQQPWRSHTHYHFSIGLSETMLPSYNQNNSDTMAVSILLDHYFAGLENLGFKNIGTPHILASYPIQFASNTWFKEHCYITIIGNVYINIKDEKALITVDISEIY